MCTAPANDEDDDDEDDDSADDVDNDDVDDDGSIQSRKSRWGDCATIATSSWNT